jgi:hypothetical protein
MRISTLLVVVVASLLPLLGACTADDDNVEGKACVSGSVVPEEQCVSGYKCIPYPEGAKCEPEKSSPLRVQDHGQQTTTPLDRLDAPPDLAHNRALLRRLGLNP